MQPILEKPSLRQWSKVNFKIGAFSLGSTSRVFLFQEALVTELGWISEADFLEGLTIAQALPGPNLVNVCSYFGYKLFGFKGAALGALCLCLPGSLLVVPAIHFISVDHPLVKKILLGLMLGSLALMGRFIWNLLKANRHPQLKIKTGLRFGIAAIVAAMQWFDFPFATLVLFNLPLCLVLEYGYGND